MKTSIRHFQKLPVVMFALAITLAPGANADELTPPPDSAKTNSQALASYKKMSLEELMDQQVTIVSRTPEKLSQSPSAVQVITGEDIHRSGAMNLAEALRLAPNLPVAQQNAYAWAVTARGFNGAPLANNSLADKLLVMIDGRTIYTPLFGGVFWDVQNVLLEDVDRIEVVSGPGATLWGDNAVNGVINVVTKSARDTQGTYVSGAGGSYWQDFGAVRYGGSIGSNLFYRVYGQRFDHNSAQLPGGNDVNDAWDMSQGGFRMDYYPSDLNTLTLQGDAYSGSEGSPVVESMDGENALGRWTRTFSDESDLKVQTYFDRTWRNLPASFFSDELETCDFDLQHRFPLGGRNEILWGAGYRLMMDKTRPLHPPAPLTFSPSDFNMQLASGFVQDEIGLVPDRLKLTLGTKLEYNDFSGIELQPSARLAWTPTGRQTVWAAVSRAVRAPSRLDTDTVIGVTRVGNAGFASEEVLAYEVGYRVRPVDRLSLSLATFYNQYSDLRSFNVPPLQFANDQSADTWGVELSGTYQATDWWRLRGGYTYLGENFWNNNAAVLPGSATLEGEDPQNQFVLQSMMDLPAHFQLDLIPRYVSRLPASPITATPATPAYFTFDARLAWQFKHVEISLVGQNLWTKEHAEFGPLTVPRGVFGKVTYRW